MLIGLQVLIRWLRSIIPFMVIGYAIYLFFNNQLMEGLVALILFELIEMNSKPSTIVMVSGDHTVEPLSTLPQHPPKAGRGSAFDNDTLDHQRVLCNECKTYIYGPPGDVSYCECNPRKMPWDEAEPGEKTANEHIKDAPQDCVSCRNGDDLLPGFECRICGREA